MVWYLFYIAKLFCFSVIHWIIIGFIDIMFPGGTGAVGQAALNICFSWGCNVFTTVSSEEKKQFLLKQYPMLLESHISNSRTTDFEWDILMVEFLFIWSNLIFNWSYHFSLRKPMVAESTFASIHWRPRSSRHRYDAWLSMADSWKLVNTIWPPIPNWAWPASSRMSPSTGFSWINWLKIYISRIQIGSWLKSSWLM